MATGKFLTVWTFAELERRRDRMFLMRFRLNACSAMEDFDSLDASQTWLKMPVAHKDKQTNRKETSDAGR